MAPKKKTPAAKPAAKPARKPNVFWKPEEHKLLAQAAALAVQRGYRGQTRGLMLSVQHVLPEARRRNPVSIPSEKWFKPALDAALKELAQAEQAKTAMQPAEAAQPEPAPTPPTPDPAERAGAPAAALPAALPVVPHTTGLGPAMLNLRAMLVDELAAVFVEAALKAMGSGLLGGGQTPQVELAPDHANGAQRIVFSAEKRRPAVLVAGLKGLQHLDIEKRFARRFDLRFVSADESKDKLRSEADRAEIAIVMKAHVAANQADIVKARTRHYVEQTGGVRELHETLSNLLN